MSRLRRAVSRTQRVLVVDDEDAVLSFAERVLVHGGYQVRTAASGAAALTIVEKEGAFDLFLIDLIMPEMRGDELARRLHTIDPDAKVLYLTGFSDELFKEKATLWTFEAFIEKPVTMNELLEAVSLLLFGHTRGLSPAR